QPGQQVVVQTLPWTLASDEFVLAVGVYAGEDGWDTGDRLPVTSAEPALPLLDGQTVARLGAFRTAAAGTWESVPPAATEPSQPLDAAFADGLRLEGVTLPATVEPGETLELALFWRADAVAALDSSVFVQLLDAADKNVAQWDGSPYDAVSKLPASNWPAGWRGEHAVALPVPADLPAGDYRVIAGMYDWQTGARLPVDDGDSVEIGRVEIGD